VIKGSQSKEKGIRIIDAVASALPHSPWGRVYLKAQSILKSDSYQLKIRLERCYF
jgi:hypothetical protein